MACPISIGDAQQIVHYAVIIYRKIKDAEGEIKAVGTQMEELDDYLGWLKRLIEAKSAVADQLDTHWNELLDRITQRMRKIKKVSQGIEAILKIFYENGSLSKYLFPFGKNPKSLRGLMEELQRHESAVHRELWSASLIPDQPAPGAVPVPAVVAQPPRPTPSPKPVKRDCGIVFVDPHNMGRSKVAEAYTKLLREWTVRTGGMMPVKFAHSAGLRVKNRSNCVEEIKNLKPSVEMWEGNGTPSKTAMESLFDNKFFNFPYKDEVKDPMVKSRSRGINDTIFQVYDYILVFHQREFSALLALKKALIAAKGRQVAPKDKCRIVHLGAYTSKDGNPKTIADAKRDANGEQSREEWNKTTSQIKMAIKGFLKEELEWKQPPKGRVEQRA